jgi:SAM-dependent methyltransferase
MVPAQQVLDVAIGTADLTIEMLRRGKAEHVTGLDLSDKMMEIGKRKVESGKRKEEIAEKGATLQIGTPYELAQNGALGQFIERGNGIEFNKDTLSVRVKKIL